MRRGDPAPAETPDQATIEAEARRQSLLLNEAASDPDSDEAAVMRELWANFVEMAADDYDPDQIAPFVLPPDWYRYVVTEGVSEELPGIYQWHIEGSGSYIGKYSHIRRPRKEYGRNVVRLVNGKPYRRGNEDGFRRIHHELARAHHEGRRITLTILENVEIAQLSLRETELIRVYGALNDPPFGRRDSR